MGGATNRRRGHTAERTVAAWFRAHGWPDAETTRARLGHDGFRQVGDIDGVPGVALEVKDCAKHELPAWMRRMEEDAGAAIPFVIVKQRGTADAGEWLLVTRLKYLPEMLADDTLEETA